MPKKKRKVIMYTANDREIILFTLRPELENKNNTRAYHNHQMRKR